MFLKKKSTKKKFSIKKEKEMFLVNFCPLVDKFTENDCCWHLQLQINIIIVHLIITIKMLKLLFWNSLKIIQTISLLRIEGSLHRQTNNNEYNLIQTLLSFNSCLDSRFIHSDIFISKLISLPKNISNLWSKKDSLWWQFHLNFV
jgi:hypothetical protein